MALRIPLSATWSAAGARTTRQRGGRLRQAGASDVISPVVTIKARASCRRRSAARSIDRRKRFRLGRVFRHGRRLQRVTLAAAGISRKLSAAGPQNAFASAAPAIMVVAHDRYFSATAAPRRPGDRRSARWQLFRDRASTAARRRLGEMLAAVFSVAREKSRCRIFSARLSALSVARKTGSDRVPGLVRGRPPFDSCPVALADASISPSRRSALSCSSAAVGDHAAVLGLARLQLPCELARKRGAGAIQGAGANTTCRRRLLTAASDSVVHSARLVSAD